MVNTLATLTTLAPDEGIKQLAAMILWLLTSQEVIKVKK
jgi:hypothetical protein